MTCTQVTGIPLTKIHHATKFLQKYHNYSCCYYTKTKQYGYVKNDKKLLTSLKRSHIDMTLLSDKELFYLNK